MKSRSGVIQISLVGLTVAAVCAAAACSTTDAGDDSAAGAGGTGTSAGNSTSTSGATSSAGTTASSGGTTSGTAGTSSSSAGTSGAAAPMGTACPTPTMASLLDFTAVDGGDGTSFGDFTPTVFSGSLYAYPPALTVDTTMGNYHLSGMVADYSGIGVALNMCNEIDLSAYDGITFTVSGSVGAAGTAANTITLIVGTAADDIESSWLNSHKASATTADQPDSFGRCVPAGNNQYDGTCATPQYVVTVTATATPVVVKWADLTGGKPSASVNPKEITSIAWVIPPPVGAGTPAPTPYPLDITLDDIGFHTAAQ